MARPRKTRVVEPASARLARRATAAQRLSSVRCLLPGSAMKRAMIVLLAACDSFAPPAPAAMPWVRGITAATVEDRQTSSATERMARLAAVSPEDPGGAIELRADVTGDGVTDTVLASYTGGALALDRRGRVIARIAGYDPAGSADDLLSIAAGDIQIGAPALLIATQSGGHRESTVTLSIYGGGGLRRMFSAPVETHDGGTTRTGAVLFVRGGLWYRAPDAAEQTYWTLERGRYVERATFAPPPPPDVTPRVGSGPTT